MKVGEMIKELEKHDLEAEVYFEAKVGSGKVTGVDFEYEFSDGVAYAILTDFPTKDA